MLLLLCKGIQQPQLGLAGWVGKRRVLFTPADLPEMSKIAILKQLKEYSLRKPEEERSHLSVYDCCFFTK